MLRDVPRDHFEQICTTMIRKQRSYYCESMAYAVQIACLVCPIFRHARLYAGHPGLSSPLSESLNARLQ